MMDDASMSARSIDCAQVPDPAGFTSLVEWLGATVVALGMSQRGLSLSCHLSEHAIEQLARKPDTTPRRSTRIRLSVALGVPLAEISRLCGLPPDQESGAAELERTAGAIPCPWCPADKRHQIPPWVPDAVARYQHGETPGDIGGSLGLSAPVVANWITHAGARRSRAEAAQLRSRVARGDQPPACDPVPCRCGCGQMTSGVLFRDKAGVWRQPRFVKGHRQRTGHGWLGGRGASLEGVGSPAFVAHVCTLLQQHGRNFAWLRKQCGYSRTAIYAPGIKRPETIARITSAFARNQIAEMTRVGCSEADAWSTIDLDAEIARAVVIAGWPDPSGSPIVLAFLRRLGTGVSRAQLARHLNVSQDMINDALKGTTAFFTVPTIERLAGPLGLSQADIDREKQRAAAGHGEAMRRGWERLSPEAKREPSRRLAELWEHEPEKMLESNRKGAATRTLPVDREEVARLLAHGPSYAAAARSLGVSTQTVQRRAKRLGIRSRRAEQRRRVEAARRLSDRHRGYAQDRRHVAADWLDAIGDQVLHVTVRDLRNAVARIHPSGKAVSSEIACALLRAAKERLNLPPR